MVDKYVVSDASNQEVNIQKRENPLDSVIRVTSAPKTDEKVQERLVAGDEAFEASNVAFAGKEESVVETRLLTYGHCKNCRTEMTEDKVIKQAIDYARAEDGTLTKAASRFSVFCKNCMQFLTIIDHDATKVLNDMIRKNIR